MTLGGHSRLGKGLPNASGPTERLMTFAPWAAANLIPAEMSSTEPVPSGLMALMARIFASGATPAMPAPLLVCAAMMLATHVPWPWPSPPPSARQGLPLPPTPTQS